MDIGELEEWATRESTHGSYLCSRFAIRPAGEVGKMGMAMSNALALVRWHGFRSLEDSDTQDKIVWLVIGVAVGMLVMWVISRRRRRWL
jgi:hypothetical protein